MITDEQGLPHLVLDGRLASWHPSGYGAISPVAAHRRVRVLTPRSTVAALAAGYPLTIHPSAIEASQAGSLPADRDQMP